MRSENGIVSLDSRSVQNENHALAQDKHYPHAKYIDAIYKSLNDRLKKQPWLDLINYTLRGIGQVIFVNNPLSGFLILIALFIQSSWVGWMSWHLGDRHHLNRNHSSARSRNYS